MHKRQSIYFKIFSVRRCSSHPLPLSRWHSHRRPTSLWPMFLSPLLLRHLWSVISSHSQSLLQPVLHSSSSCPQLQHQQPSKLLIRCTLTARSWRLVLQMPPYRTSKPHRYHTCTIFIGFYDQPLSNVLRSLNTEKSLKLKGFRQHLTFVPQNFGLAISKNSRVCCSTEF